MAKPYQQHLKSAKDLQTPYEATRAGFVGLALEKNRRATPLVAQARALKTAATQAKTPADLLSISDIRPALLTAAGLSDKALKHLQESDKIEAIHGLLNKYLEPAGAKFVEELVYRFLLTRGDTLGGSMRNAGGFVAQCKLTRAIIGHLKMADKPCCWLHSKNKVWAEIPNDDAGIELHLRGLSWGESDEARTLIYNVTVPLFRKNVDMCLFTCSSQTFAKSFYRNASAYIALGELKGGIDPAGADEHWKTAKSALNRIRDSFTKESRQPKAFFIGAAIEAQMSVEIWDWLETGILENAANLTDENQIASITRWLCSL